MKKQGCLVFYLILHDHSKDEMVHKVIIRGELLECQTQVSQ